MPLGVKFKKIMEANDLKQSEFAKKIGADPRHLGTVLKRDTEKSPLAKGAADAFGIPLEWFYDDDDLPLPKSGGQARASAGTARQSTEQSARDVSMDHGRISADLLRAWWALPEKLRNQFKREIVAQALPWMDEVPDDKLHHLAAPGTDSAEKARKPKGGTQ